ncbi:PAS domain S-box protein [Paucibacter sp. TC2R-5]|uniref:PAS domain-containing sensor histidine kinase n=1 Tax=Paucibacter sp. TC2R-5 TaxID=2893555 RepID=UPI0021E40F59|nr:sensor histidine kinase [Paucibacter sp. TC2R-5]MCV2359519.1 PAS domain S-box protein [Paucibacter sp. TC2R-5]
MLLSRLLPSSLIGRVFLLYLISMLIFMGGAMGWYASRSYSNSINSAQDSADTLISLLGPVVSDSAVIGDYETIERALERSAKHADIGAALFIDLKGGRIERRAHATPRSRAPLWLEHDIDEQLGDLNLTIAAGGKDYGVLRLHFNSEQIASDFWQQTIFALSLAGLSLLASLGLVWWPLKHWLGNLGQIQAFGEQMQVAGGVLSPMLSEDAPLEFRKTFEVLNQAAHSLQLERERAAVTLAAIGDGIATTDAAGLIMLANPVLAEMLGRTQAALLGQLIQSLVPELPAELPRDSGTAKSWTVRVRPAHAQAIAPTKTQAMGRFKVLDLSVSLISGADGQVAGYVLAFRDITEQQALEDRLQSELSERASALQTLRSMLQAPASGTQSSSSSDDISAVLQLVQTLLASLRERGEQLATIFALSPDGFVSFDADRVTRYISPAFARLAGLAAGTGLGLHEDELMQQMTANCPPSALRLEFSQLRQGKQRIELERPTRRVLELSLHEGRPGENQVEGQEKNVSQLLHLSDVTHQVEVEQMKSEFLSTAAHELRTPMASIYGFTELLMTREVSPEKQKLMLARIYRQCEAMIAILNELLDLARIEARRGKDFELERCELNSLVDEVVQDYPPPAERNAPLLNFALPQVQVHVDRKKLQQVLRNLLSNAYKYSPDGGEVRVQVFADPAEDSRCVCIEVQDQGIGMTPEELSHVSERFYRADKSGTVLGTGLGMSIVKEIIDLLGGQMSLSSEPGQGTTVRLSLPRLDASLTEGT